MFRDKISISDLGSYRWGEWIAKRRRQEDSHIRNEPRDQFRVNDDLGSERGQSNEEVCED